MYQNNTELGKGLDEPYAEQEQRCRNREQILDTAEEGAGGTH